MVEAVIGVESVVRESLEHLIGNQVIVNTGCSITIEFIDAELILLAASELESDTSQESFALTKPFRKYGLLTVRLRTRLSTTGATWLLRELRDS